MMSQSKPKVEIPHFDHPQTQSSFSPYAGSGRNSDGSLNSLQAAPNSPNESFAPTKQRVNFNTDIIGLFQTVSTAPKQVPNSPYEQVQIYVNGSTYRLYWYDAVGAVWHYVTATA